MTELNIILISILQGITEFLPVSSSGHLILFSKFSSFPDQGLELDVAVHIGSILAVMIYFSKDLFKMLKDLCKSFFWPNFKLEGNRIFYLIIIATIPAVVMGLIFHIYGTEWVRNTKLIGWNILIFGIVLYIADTTGMTVRKVKHLTIVDAILIGVAQCVSLLPGTSRSGITITMGRFLGLERREAAKFSMLLSIPTILGAGILVGLDIYKQGNFELMRYAIDGVIYSFAASIIAIYTIMWWLRGKTFLPFVIYRIILGTILLLVSYEYINL